MDPDHDHRLIVRNRRIVTEQIDVRENRVRQGLGRVVAMFLQQPRHTPARKVFLLAVELILYAIREKQHQIARFRLVNHFVVFAILEQPDRDPLRLRLQDLAAPVMRGGSAPALQILNCCSRGSHSASVRVAYCASTLRSRSVSFNALMSIAGLRLRGCQNPQQAADQRAIQSCCRAFAADIAKRDDRVLVAVLEEVVHVARNLARGPRNG